jgi:hypothetical protein
MSGTGLVAPGREAHFRRIPVPFDLDASLAVFERHLQNLIGQVPVGVKFVQHLTEEFSLERKVHALWRIKADQPSMERHIGILAFRTWCPSRPAEVVTISGH